MKRFALTGCLLLGLAAIPCTTPAAPVEVSPTLGLTPLKAVYHVKISGFGGGFGSGKGELELRGDSGGLTYRMTLAPTGLLAIFADTVEITARMRLEGGRVVPEEYMKRHRKNKDKDRRYAFDPGRSSVEVLQEGKTWFLEASDGTLDEASMQLQLILDAQRHNGPWRYTVMSNDKIKHYSLTETGNESIDSAFGRIETIKLQRVRLHAGEQSEIDYYYWLSPAHRYLPIRVEKLENGKTKRVLTAREIRFD